MAEKLNPNVLYVRDPRESVSSLDSDRLTQPDAGDESSDSDGEQEISHKLIRKVSTSGQIRAKKSVKEGLLLKQTSSFQRWKRRYFKLRGRTLYYAKDSKSLIFDEVDLSDASVAETSTKNINNSFTVITPFRKLILCAENRKEMEDWISTLKSVQKWEIYEASQFNMEHFSGMHNWYACSHARPTFCNVCREVLSGVTSHGLSCEVCKFKAHKRCAVRSTNNCKWTTLASIGNDIIEDEDGVAMPHQWLEGNLPVSAKCAVCDKTCGSVRRLQDCRCLWCKAIVHSACKEQFGKKCPLGPFRVSIIPPTALNSIDSDGFWKATSPSCSSPLLVLVNSKSGDNQGVKFLRKFKQLLNPAQVFDLMNGGPHLGLRLFQKFATFRILVCGGDGSVGWVLSELDKLGLHKQCQLGVLPLGTGNDLARVLGWGGLCDDDTQLLQILEKLERATTKMLDRWSILTYELPSKQPPPAIKQEENGDSVLQVQMTQYSDSVAFHLAKILDSDKHADVISSAKFLCGTVNEFVAEVGKAYERATENKEEADTMAKKCALLNEKLDSLVKTLSEEADAVLMPTGSPVTPPTETSQGGNKEEDTLPRVFRSKDQLMLRANSLKKALRQIIEQAEKVVDEQNKHTQVYRMSSSSSMPLKKDNSEEFKEKEADTLRRGTVSSTTSSIFLEKSDSFSSVHFTEDPNSIQCTEKCVMNNYFGIGLDAKISLEFNNKRDEHPKKCSSRTKNMMWYGVLGTKELLQKTYKNLEQRVQLECDGVPMSLPSLQGLAVLNIPSYAGGINFWGGTKEDNFFGAPSFDDKKLEVVAVFGSMQMAMSRVINLQHHRIAQCRSVKITILGDEGVPVQVDGEAWVQPPGILKIVHKNRAQMLTRDRAFESTLKSWEDKRKCDNYRGSRPRLNSQQSMEYLTEEEYSQLQQFGQAGDTLINKIREAAKTQKAIEQELAHPVNASALILNESFSNKASTPEYLSRNAAVDIVNSVKVLQLETKMLLEGKLLQLESPQEEGLHSALNNLSNELQKVAEIHWIAHIINCTEEEGPKSSSKSSMKLKIMPKAKREREKLQKQRSNSSLPVKKWGTEEVAAWLDSVGLGEYKDIFIRHDIQGSELVLLERRDLKDLGIKKVGHMKRILQGIKEMSSHI
ncbi:diacylglycerol kinase delta-like isoform X1 [Acipenser ruthenus]|uniref:diacylglycerol kinase delta-like isoform X1 n=1 Tax=Acipenser ruthenus TaxID=7906 RepID=UPI00145C179E|nr:diacylglycerol kinase delta-like isoform X1 [Acipenser ruthenus]XP_058845079.1 diacylglycerol kinase delta-like isoform X1 [Acipenser ruthenus]XP_058845080.1 diacylglycerol kinase delta-like isoform X1 [Acipenser ruthenus]